MKLPIQPPYPPMEAKLIAEIPTGDEYQYEPKWDGFRCLAFRDGDEEESARIARGNVRDIAKANADDFDALILPGGFGAAKNLSDFASKGDQCAVNKDVQRLITDAYAARKPIGLACIAPALAAAILGRAGKNPRLTIGTDPDTANALNAMGAHHQHTSPTDICVDHENLLVTTPCYMNDVGPWTVFQGAEKMVEEVLRLAGDTASLIRKEMATFR